MLEWMYSKSIRFGSAVILFASYRGKSKLLNGSYLCFETVRGNQLGTLIWLRNKGCTRNLDIRSKFAKGEIKEWIFRELQKR
jgi:hypothetical protein